MELTREMCEREIGACKAAIKGSKESITVNRIVLRAFEEAVEQMPKKEKDLNKPESIG